MPTRRRTRPVLISWNISSDVAAIFDLTTQPVWSWNGFTQLYAGSVLPSSA